MYKVPFSFKTLRESSSDQAWKTTQSRVHSTLGTVFHFALQTHHIRMGCPRYVFWTLILQVMQYAIENHVITYNRSPSDHWPYLMPSSKFRDYCIGVWNRLEFCVQVQIKYIVVDFSIHIKQKCCFKTDSIMFFFKCRIIPGEIILFLIFLISAEWNVLPAQGGSNDFTTIFTDLFSISEYMSESKV